MNEKFIEVKLTPETNALSGSEVYYKCLKCGDTVQSTPKNAARCSCRNINIDADAGRISIKNYDLTVMLKRE